MYLKVPPQEIRSAGAKLTNIADEMAGLCREANSIYRALGGCYDHGGSAAYNKMSAVVARMTSDRDKVLARGVDGLVTAALVYETNENEIQARSSEVVSAIENGYRVDWSARPSVSAVLASTVGAYAAVSTNLRESWSQLQALSEEPTYNQRVFGKTIGTAIDNIKASYENHGFVYDAVQYGKCALRVAKGAIKIVGAVGAFATGVGVPIAIAGIISAGNDMINAATDAAYVATDQYDMVGTTNLLKDTLVKGYGDLGEMLGNREAGETFGKLTYTGLDVVSFLDGADKMLKAYGKVNTDIYGSTGYSFVWGKTSWDDQFDNKIKWTGIIDDKFDLTNFSGIIRNGLGVHPDSTGNFIYEAIEKTYKVYKKGSSLAGKLAEIAAN